MMLYRYVKAPVGTNGQPAQPRWRRLLPSILITLGSVLLANVAWPWISHYLVVSPQFKREPILSPLPPRGPVTFVSALPSEVKAEEDSLTEEILGETVDYTKARSWFPGAPFPEVNGYEAEKYLLTIPKLGIDDAEVEVGGESLEQSLVHYPGTALPGGYGSPVIFGHSILRQFYAPEKTNPQRYISIFSTIMTLVRGDTLIIDYDGIRYEYRVREKVVVKPEDVYILQQRLDRRELKLVTCVPEGTYKERGVVIADLVSLH